MTFCDNVTSVAFVHNSQNTAGKLVILFLGTKSISYHHSKMWITSLPPYYLLEFNQKWLRVKEICGLNTAFCNKKYRESLVHIVHIISQGSSISRSEKPHVVWKIGIKYGLQGIEHTRKILILNSQNLDDKFKILLNSEKTNSLSEISFIQSDSTLSDMYFAPLLDIQHEETKHKKKFIITSDQIVILDNYPENTVYCGHLVNNKYDGNGHLVKYNRDRVMWEYDGNII